MNYSGPDIDPLLNPQNETEEFLVQLSLAHLDFDENIANAKIQLERAEDPYEGVIVQTRSFWAIELGAS